MAGQKILLVDDEQDILDLLGYNLRKEGYEIFTANNGRDAISVAEEVVPDLILMDVMMPELDGMEATTLIRENPALKDCIVAFLTARAEDYSQIAGFDAGADDYITKPIKPKVLVSKVRGLLRRNTVGQSDVLDEPLEGLQIDHERYLVIKDGEELVLPKKEFQLLVLLASKPGHVFTRDRILDRIWGNEVVVGDRTIDVHIRKLREKLGQESIYTVKGVGYKLKES
jgi:two-component system alkaline phosphatase synthesis response regulator PhoP